jgi:hypothetical protein
MRILSKARRGDGAHTLLLLAEHECALLSLDIKAYGRRVTPQSVAVCDTPPPVGQETLAERYAHEVARASAMACHVRLLRAAGRTANVPTRGEDAWQWYREYREAFRAVQHDLHILRASVLFTALTVMTAAAPGGSLADTLPIRDELLACAAGHDVDATELWHGFWVKALAARLRLRSPEQWPPPSAYLREWHVTHGLEGCGETLRVLQRSAAAAAVV